MPINASPEFYAAERRYNETKSLTDRLKALQEMLKLSPGHKGAEVLRADIKSKIAKLKQLLEKEQASKKGRHQFMIKKEGASQVVMCGVTNSGKSYLLSKLTNAKPIIADYEYTTKMPEVGVMDYQGVKIQIVEMPAILEDYIYKDNGGLFFSIIRNADLVLFLIKEKKEVDFLKEEFEKANIKLNKKRPHVVIKKEPSGGINIIGKTKLKHEDIIEKCRNYSIYNAMIGFHEDVSLDEFDELLNSSTVFLQMMVVKNEFKKFKLEDIQKKIWNNLNLIKVYTKSPGKKKDYPPIALEKGSTIRDIAQTVHKDFLKNFRFARVWGSSKFSGQALGLDYELKDEDIVEIHMK